MADRLMLRSRSISIKAPMELAIALILTSCSESRISQCERLIDVVQQTETSIQSFETEIERFSRNAIVVRSVDDIVIAGKRYTTALNQEITDLNNLADELEATELTDKTLLELKGQYIEVVRGFSLALSQANSAMVSMVDEDAEADLSSRFKQLKENTLEAVEAIEKLGEQETKLAGQVNDYCGFN
ncbi:MAG: hypothetical protein F6K19_23590 [Cyanothece sp. SIO1E1]|nr:hypothetical protein [Cyanothece sp. SIO1E1]